MENLDNTRKYYNKMLLEKKFEEIWLFDYAFDLFQELSKLKINTRIPEIKVNIPDETLLEMVDTFYKNYTPIKYYQAFIKTYLTANVNILTRESANCSGLHLQRQDGTSTITIIKQKFFDDCLALTHEFAHGISYNLNQNLYNYRLKLCEEIITIFMEVLCAKYYGNLGFDILSVPRLENIYRARIKCAKELNALIEMHNKYKFKNCIKHDDLLNCEHATENAHPETAQYIIAYVIAVNLLKIHESDPEYAFFLLDKSIYYDETIFDFALYSEFEKLGLLNTDTLKDHKKELVLERKRLYKQN